MVVEQFCTQCGSENDTGMTFCSSCGTKIESPEPKPVSLLKDSKLIGNSDADKKNVPHSQKPETSNHSFLQGIAGHASDSSVEEAVENYGDMLVPNENV